MKTRVRSKLNASVMYRATLGVLLWACLTIALAAMVIHTDRSLEGLIGWHVDSGLAFFGAVIVGMFMGALIENTKALIPSILLSAAVAAATYVSLLYYPVWRGTLVETVGLENFATTRALLYFGITVIPLSIGAVAGRLLGPMIPGGDLLSRRRNAGRETWWLDRPTRISDDQAKTS